MTLIKKKRLHDEIYLKSNRYKKPKESFKLLYKILKKKLSNNKNYRLLDVGCANGELLFFLHQKFSNIEFCGIDVRNDLIKLAKKKCSSDIYFKRLDYTQNQNFNKKFDIIISSGVIGIFDNLDIFFKNIKKNMRKKTTLFLFSNFNNYDFDIFSAYKDLNSKNNNYQSGWNIWSIKTIKKYFKKKKIIKHLFNIKFDVRQNKKDLVRTWTIKINKKRYFTNALGLIFNQMWLEIS